MGGLIPAHAGKTPRKTDAWARNRAHPRSRGENRSPSTRTATRLGSSPLTRGKLERLAVLFHGGGLIPAHAGKTASRTSPSQPYEAHPRSRGENRRPPRFRRRHVGSSPLTRGKLIAACAGAALAGLIPAHAGKTRWSGRGRSRWWAHPRSRGENLDKGASGLMASGSSPLTRGKLRFRGFRCPHKGLIPAHAGKTPRSSACRGRSRAHPRSRGENLQCLPEGKQQVGSSPLTRGKYFLTCAFIAQIGQILESRELCASSESYSLRNVYATAAPQDQVRSIGLAPLSSRGAS